MFITTDWKLPRSYSVKVRSGHSCLLSWIWERQALQRWTLRKNLFLTPNNWSPQKLSYPEPVSAVRKRGKLEEGDRGKPAVMVGSHFWEKQEVMSGVSRNCWKLCHRTIAFLAIPRVTWCYFQWWQSFLWEGEWIEELREYEGKRQKTAVNGMELGIGKERWKECR